MKRNQIIIAMGLGGALCLGGALAAVAAYTISGSYNTSLGYLAGKGSYGDKATVMGAGTGAQSQGLNRTDLFGTAAGVGSAQLTDCVAIGYRAMRGATNCSDCVAIGKNAMAGESGVSGKTYINGHFTCTSSGWTIGTGANALSCSGGVLSGANVSQITGGGLTEDTLSDGTYTIHADLRVERPCAWSAWSVTSKTDGDQDQNLVWCAATNIEGTAYSAGWYVEGYEPYYIGVSVADGQFVEVTMTHHIDELILASTNWYATTASAEVYSETLSDAAGFRETATMRWSRTVLTNETIKIITTADIHSIVESVVNTVLNARGF